MRIRQHNTAKTHGSRGSACVAAAVADAAVVADVLTVVVGGVLTGSRHESLRHRTRARQGRELRSCTGSELAAGCRARGHRLRMRKPARALP